MLTFLPWMSGVWQNSKRNKLLKKKLIRRWSVPLDNKKKERISLTGSRNELSKSINRCENDLWISLEDKEINEEWRSRLEDSLK